MIRYLNEYQTLIFDCDGVVLNSNKIKTQAFYEAAKHFGHDPAQALVDYPVANGGNPAMPSLTGFNTKRRLVSGKLPSNFVRVAL